MTPKASIKTNRYTTPLKEPKNLFNMNEITGASPIALLTVDQFLALAEQARKSAVDKEKEIATNEKRYVYGIKGLAKLIGSSNMTAQRLKDSGRITFVQSGRKLIFDADLVLSELTKSKTV